MQLIRNNCADPWTQLAQWPRAGELKTRYGAAEGSSARPRHSSARLPAVILGKQVVDVSDPA